MNLSIFQNPYDIFQFYFTYSKQNKALNVTLLIQSHGKFLSDMESCYKIKSKTYNVTFIFLN